MGEAKLKQIISENDFLDRWRCDGNIRGGENLVYFPDTTLEIIGMVTTRGGVKPHLRQLFVVISQGALAFPVHIRTALEDRGFRLLDPDNEVWLSPDRSYYLTDPGQNNVDTFAKSRMHPSTSSGRTDY